MQADAESTDQVLEALRRPVDELGVTEPTPARVGERRIVVELPGLREPRESLEVIGRTARSPPCPDRGRVDAATAGVDLQTAVGWFVTPDIETARAADQ